MPNGKVVLIRQDGTRLDASPEQAEKLKLLGYKEETPEEMHEAARSDSEQEFYTSTGQQIATGIEGLARGASVGLSDFVIGDEGTGKRAAYNPGIATTAEIAGGIGAEMIPGVNMVAPAALVGKGSRALVKGTGVGAAAVRGAIDGGVFGGGLAADHAYISGDPITTEAVMHGIGWGALFGAGLSAAGEGLAVRGRSNISKGAQMEAESGSYVGVEGAESNLALKEANLAGERAALAKAEAQAKAGGTRFEATPGTFESTANPTFSSFRAEAKNVAQNLKRSTETVEALMSGNKKKLAQLGVNSTMNIEALGMARNELKSAFGRVSKAMNKKGFSGAKLEEAMKTYEAVAAKVATKAGLSTTDSGRRALMEYAQAKVVQKQLTKFPHSAEAFANMSEKKAEELFAAMSSIKKATNYKAFGEALESQSNKFQEAMGVKPNGVDGLRAAWNAAKKAVRAEKTAVKFTDFKMQRAELNIREADLAAERAKLAAQKAQTPAYEPGLIKRGIASAVGFGAYKASQSALGHPLVALGAASKARSWVLNFGKPKSPALMAARNATLGRIKQAVGKYQVGTGKVMGVAAPRISPLALRLDGTPDTSTKNMQQLAYNRIAEFARESVHIKDTMYRAIEPIAMEQPELGPALHKASVDSFMAMRSMLPSDPGVVSGLKSIWNPSQIQSAIMERQLEVWHDPIGTVESMLETGEYDPIKIKTLKNVAPASYQQLRVEMIGKIQEPGLLDSMDYRQQVAVGALLDIPIHSSMRPEFIAASQALHTNRNQPLPSPSIPGSTNGGRPAADTPGATAAQISTQR